MFKSLKIRFILVFGIYFFISLSIVTVIAGFTVQDTAISFAKTLGDPVVKKAATLINGDEYQSFLSVMSDKDAYYEDTRLKLLDLKESTGCRFLFTMSNINGKYLYIIDGSCSPSDKDNFSPLGTQEDLSSWGDAPIIAFEKGILASSEIEKQEGWGWTISTYYPIFNSSKKVVGIIGCDFGVDALMNQLTSKIIRIALLSLLLVIIGCFVVRIFTYRIFGTMNTIQISLDKISNGEADLTERLPEKGGIELENLARSTNKVIKAMNDLVSVLKNQTSVLQDTSNQVSAKMEQSVNNIEQVVYNVTNIEDKITKQSDQINNVTQSVSVVEEQLNGLDTRIEEQSSSIVNASQAIEEIKANIESVNKAVEKISDEYAVLVQESISGKQNQEQVSSQIVQIVEQSKNLNMTNQAIAKIASQTNLLAMNAAIEAAHAGKAGQGFGVVADEIRALAESSAKQTGEIKTLLKSVTASINGVVEKSNQSNQSFVNLEHRIQTLDGMLKQVRDGIEEEKQGVINIVNTMHNLEDTTHAITSANEKMRNESSNLFVGIDDLTRISQETNEMSAEVSSSMKEMKSVSLDAKQASTKNKEATDKVLDTITGFRV